MKRGCKYWLRLTSVGLLGGLFLACLVIEVVYVISAANPSPSSINHNPADVGLEYEDITFSSYDDTSLAGWFIPSHNNATIILLHGYGANRTEWIKHVEILAQHGYGILIYDLRAHGQSGGKQRTYGWLDDEDVMAALDYLDYRNDVNMEHIGIFGFSVGGQIAIRAAARTDQIKAVFVDDPGYVTIKDAPPPTSNLLRLLYMINWLDYKGMQLWTGAQEPPGVIEAIGVISPRPLFLAASGGLGNSLMHHYYEYAKEPKSFWEIPEASHGKSFTARPQEYEEKMVDFFENALLR